VTKVTFRSQFVQPIGLVLPAIKCRWQATLFMPLVYLIHSSTEFVLWWCCYGDESELKATVKPMQIVIKVLKADYVIW